MEEIRVNYLVKYTGVSNPDIKNGKVYKCIAEWYDEKNQLHDLAVVDDSGEDYLYSPKAFEKCNQCKKFSWKKHPSKNAKIRVYLFWR